MTKIHFTSHGFTLSGNLFRAAKPRKPAFLFIQGWMGTQNVQAAKLLAEKGFTCITYDMRGNGGSEGDIADFSRADFIADAVTAYDYLREQVGEDTPIGVIGGSFGSYTAVLLAAQRDVFCLSLRVPANYPDEGFAQPHAPHAGTPELMAWRRKPLNFTDNRVLAELHTFDGPVQIIEAENDEMVPRRTVQNYIDAAADPAKLQYRLMRDAPHRLETPARNKEYQQLLTAWITSLIEP